MSAMKAIGVVVACAALLGSVAVRAADLAVISAGALEAGITQLATQFERDTRHTVRVQIGNAPQITARLASGDTADVLVAPAAIVEQALKDGVAVRTTRETIGRVGVAVVVRAGAPRPDIATVDALRTALLAAPAVIYNQGSSGTYIEQMLAGLGIADRVNAKRVRVLNGEAVMERMAAATGDEIAFLAMSDAIRAGGLQFVGPLPPALQNFTMYEAAVMSQAREPVVAAQFVRSIAGPQARTVWMRAGVE